MKDDNEEQKDRLQSLMLGNLVDVRNAKSFALNVDNLIRAVYLKLRDGLDVAEDFEAIVEYTTRNHFWFQNQERVLMESFHQPQDNTTDGIGDAKPVIH